MAAAPVAPEIGPARDDPRVFSFLSFQLDERCCELRDQGFAVEVHATPLRLLRYLVRNRDRVVPKGEVLDFVWTGTAVSESALSSALWEIRSALRDNGAQQQIIRTERGRGYRFIAAVDERPAAAHVAPTSMSVAALPFLDMSFDEDQLCFADGLVEEITHELCQCELLQVAARTSAFAFRGAAVSVREIGHSLRVSHLIEGSVRRSGRRVRCTAQLIRVDDGYHLWSGCYEESLSRPLIAQQEVAREVARQTTRHLTRSWQGNPLRDGVRL